MSLVMLSRDSWTRSRSEHDEQRWAPGARSEPDEDNDDISLFGEDGHEGVATAPRPRGRFQCGACRKVFRSYQALGGHRACRKARASACRPCQRRCRPRLAARTSSTSAPTASACSAPGRRWAATSARTWRWPRRQQPSVATARGPSISTCRPRWTTTLSSPPCTTRSSVAAPDSEIAR
jgi:hypothetical protein